MVTFLNPPDVHTPVGTYSHTALVPGGTELLFISGQVGVRPDGSTPTTIAEQATQVFANMSALLGAHGVDATALVKLTMFVVAGQDLQSVRAARSKFLGAHKPASTAVFVPALVDPSLLVEVEAVAVTARR